MRNKAYFYSYEECKDFIRDLMSKEYIFPNKIKIYKRHNKKSNLLWVVAFDIYNDNFIDKNKLLNLTE